MWRAQESYELFRGRSVLRGIEFRAERWRPVLVGDPPADDFQAVRRQLVVEPDALTRRLRKVPTVHKRIGRVDADRNAGTLVRLRFA